MNTNIVIALDTRRKTKDGLYPVVLRLGHNRMTIAVPTGIHIPEKDWDAKKRWIKGTYSGVSSVTRLNNILQKQRSDAMDKVLKLNESGELQLLSVVELKVKLFAKKNTGQSFYNYAEHVIQEMKKANRVGTARSYNSVLLALKKYCGDKLEFKEINHKFLTRFETNFLSVGNAANGFAVYMRTIRSIYNKAIKDGVCEKEFYPFDLYKIKTVPTEKRALDWELLKKIIELQLEPDHPCFNARNYFLASYMMYGMNYTDMAFLRKTDIIDGRIKYRRRKTSKIYDIKISEALSTILKHYIELHPNSDFVFPILKRNHLSLQYKDIDWARKRYNAKLKKLAEKCEISETLTSYVSRHSFATQAMLQHVPLNAISAMLGHSSLKTTEVYLKSLPSNVLDDYNAKIMGAL